MLFYLFCTCDADVMLSLTVLLSCIVIHLFLNIPGFNITCIFSFFIFLKALRKL